MSKTKALPKETQVKTIITHDSMMFKAWFPSGAVLNWRISRTRETLDVRFSNDDDVLKKQVKVVAKYLKKLQGNNAMKFHMLEQLVLPCKFGCDVIRAMESAIELMPEN